MKTAEEKAMNLLVGFNWIFQLNDDNQDELQRGIELLLKEQDRDTRHACAEAKIMPMSEAPRDEEILAYHKKGKNFHQVKWKDHKKRWGMRWHEEYSQSDFDYDGWLPMPEVEFV